MTEQQATDTAETETHTLTYDGDLRGKFEERLYGPDQAQERYWRPVMTEYDEERGKTLVTFEVVDAYDLMSGAAQ